MVAGPEDQMTVECIYTQSNMRSHRCHEPCLWEALGVAVVSQMLKLLHVCLSVGHARTWHLDNVVEPAPALFMKSDAGASSGSCNEQEPVPALSSDCGRLRLAVCRFHLLVLVWLP